jgi:hypothetical protein
MYGMNSTNVRYSREIDLSRFTAVNATEASSKMSDKYLFIPTSKAIDAITERGWKPTFVQQSRTRDELREGYQKHLIRFRQESCNPLAVPGEIYPEIILVNAHDGGASFQVKLGLFRVVCCNGLAVSDASFETLRIRHTGYSNVKIGNAVKQLTGEIPAITERVREFMDVDLTPDERGVFAKAALVARYGKEDMEKRTFDHDFLLKPRRQADTRTDLFTTMNVLQEKLINGGPKAEQKTDKYGRRNWHAIRKVNSVNENLRINQALWALTEKMAELKTA